MTATQAFKKEIQNRHTQRTKLEKALESAIEEDVAEAIRAQSMLHRANESLVAADHLIDQGNFSEAVYLFAQGCWNLGCAQGITRRV